MKGGINKILRNIVAGSSDTEFEKVSLGPRPLNLRHQSVLTVLCGVATDEGDVPLGLEGAKGETRDL